MLDTATITALARQLYDARKARTPLRHFSRQYPQMSIDDGYAIQRAWVMPRAFTESRMRRRSTSCVPIGAASAATPMRCITRALRS